jgi:hypothetical protein
MNLLGLKYGEQRSSGPEFYLSLELNEKATHLLVGSLTVQNCVCSCTIYGINIQLTYPSSDSSFCTVFPKYECESLKRIDIKVSE